MLGRLFKKPSDGLDVAAATAGMGLVSMDNSFLNYYGAVATQRGISAEHQRDAIAALVRQLTEIKTDDPACYFMDARYAIYKRESDTWPPEAKEAFFQAFAIPWAPTSEQEESWNRLPRPVQSAYMRQGRAQIFATFAEFSQG